MKKYFLMIAAGVTLALATVSCELPLLSDLVTGFDIEIDGPANSVRVTGASWGYAGDTIQFFYGVIDDDGNPTTGEVEWTSLTPKLIRILSQTDSTVTILLGQPEKGPVSASLLALAQSTKKGRLKAKVSRLAAIDLGIYFNDAGRDQEAGSFVWTAVVPDSLRRLTVGNQYTVCAVGVAQNGRGLSASDTICANQWNLEGGNNIKTVDFNLFEWNISDTTVINWVTPPPASSPQAVERYYLSHWGEDYESRFGQQ